MLLLLISIHSFGWLPKDSNDINQHKTAVAKVVYQEIVPSVPVAKSRVLGPVSMPALVEEPVSRAGGTKLRESTLSKLKGKRVQFVITAYSAQDKGVNRRGITASGAVARPWYTVAASKSYPFGTRIHLVPLNKTVVVQDRGGAIKGNRLDLFVSSKKQAIQFGRQKMEGIVLEK